MPLFKHNSDANERESARSTSPTRKGSMFSRRSPSPVASSNSSSSTRGSFFARNNGDPAVNAARQKVSSAESAERDAEKALVAARSAVKEAKEHARRLEREAEEEYVVFFSPSGPHFLRGC
jgi:hypothetical protein